MPFLEFDVNKTNVTPATQFLPDGFKPTTVGDNGWLNWILNLMTYHVQLPTGSAVFFLSETLDTQYKGYVKAGGETIGNTGSGAQEAGPDYENLFKMLWENDVDNHLTVSPSKGASADADWTALKSITVPDLKGHILVGQSTSSTNFNQLFKKSGAETHALTIDETPEHSHTYEKAINSVNAATHDESVYSLNVSDNTEKAGSGTPHNNIQPSLVGQYWIKL